MELGGPDYAKSGPKVRRTTEFRNETGDEKKILLLVRCCGAGRPRLRHVRPKARIASGFSYQPSIILNVVLLSLERRTVELGSPDYAESGPNVKGLGFNDHIGARCNPF